MEAKVSVIVPVYNVELYLEECLDSIICQTFKEIEIILINDGSIDRSLDIMELYASKDSRITVLNQPNRGVSVARNAGIQHASGEYILFADSDDTIVPEAIEELYRKAGETGADLVIGKRN
jgi:glycosyltransferase involved in cell wall biosynthesis